MGHRQVAQVVEVAPVLLEEQHQTAVAVELVQHCQASPVLLILAAVAVVVVVMQVSPVAFTHHAMAVPAS
jgi:hypothetical protein